MTDLQRAIWIELDVELIILKTKLQSMEKVLYNANKTHEYLIIQEQIKLLEEQQKLLTP